MLFWESAARELAPEPPDTALCALLDFERVGDKGDGCVARGVRPLVMADGARLGCSEPVSS